MRFWMFLRDLPVEIIGWLFWLKARDAMNSYEKTAGMIEVGFGSGSKAQMRLIKASDPNLQRLKWRAIRITATTIAIQLTLFAAIVALTLRTP